MVLDRAAFTGRAALTLVLLIGACFDQEPVEELSEVSGNVTISRVPNPPLQSDLNNLPGDLKGVAVPTPPTLADYVADPAKAVLLGKALFWDMQVGSDGVQACATCHFRAGADPRSKNALSPGLNHAPQSDLDFATAGPNAQLRTTDFPLTKLAVPGVRGALDPQTDSNDVVASAGVHYSGEQGKDPMGFRIGRKNTRRVEPRNTPTVINAVFNHRQFRDGRAEAVFNGVNHRGARDPNARVVRATSPGAPELVQIAIEQASLASQAVAPILNEIEMAAPGRTMLDVASRLKDRRPLALQQVHREDSVLGPLSRWPARGIHVNSYEQLIKQAFHPRWWDSTKLVQILPNGTVRFVTRPDNSSSTREATVLEYNWALFFGLAIQMYEATLVSAETPWDKFRRQHPTATDPMLNPWNNAAPAFITREALFGAMLFNDRTRGPSNIRCTNCHEQAELTDASVRRITTLGPVRNRDGNIIDRGYNNIGLRPTADDLGVGGEDAYGSLSHSKRMFPNGPPAFFDNADVTKGFGVDGAIKIPSLRNVELTAPYYRNGETDSLREAVAFYSRGGNVAPIKAMDGTPIEPLGIAVLTDPELDALVAFLKALTDERVLYRKAPFDHPQLFVPNGHWGTESLVIDLNWDGLADDKFLEIGAVGEDGGAPIPAFLQGPFAPKQHHGGGHHDDDDGCD